MSRIKTSLREPSIDNRLLDERGPTFERQQRAMAPPIVYAHAKGQLTHAQYAAGQKLYMHWINGFGPGMRTPDFDAVRISFAPSDHAAKSIQQEHHRDRVHQAAQLLGELKFGVIKQAVCEEIPFAEIGAGMGYRDREYALSKALTEARNGLDILCKEWGIQST